MIFMFISDNKYEISVSTFISPKCAKTFPKFSYNS